MRNIRNLWGCAFFVATMACISLAGVGQTGTAGGQTEFEEFRGRVVSGATVELQPRVSGYVTKVFFRDGATVRQGELLFELDSRVYEAQWNAAKAQAAANDATLKYATATYDRFRNLAKIEKGAVSVNELDQYLALKDQAVANLELSRANLALAQLNLDWTKITSPTDGRIDRALLSPGNHVAADTTALATIVADGPRYVTFDVDQEKHLQLAKLGKDATAKGNTNGFPPVLIGLASDKEHFPYHGIVDAVGVKIEPGTTKVRWRAAVADLDPGVLPGFVVNVRLPTKRLDIKK